MVNSPQLHSRPFAWEAAILKFEAHSGIDGELDYSTSLTEDVEVFATEGEAHAFLEKARRLFAAEEAAWEVEEALWCSYQAARTARNEARHDGAPQEVEAEYAQKAFCAKRVWEEAHARAAAWSSRTDES